jgi:hypothetical protein
MTPEEARIRCQETRASYAATRRYKDAFWTLQMAYDVGRQWGSLRDMGGNLGVEISKGLTDIYGDNNAPLRITINEIGSHDRKVASMTSPQHIGATVFGPAHTTDTYTRTAGKVLMGVLERIGMAECNALEMIRGANRDRVILGSAGIGEELRMVGRGQVVLPTQGRRQQKALRQFAIDWAPVMPWEIIRSPAAKTVHMARDEDTILHEKPRTVGWMASKWGIGINTEATLGDLTHFLDTIRHLQGGPEFGNLMSEAKDKAVLGIQGWLTDPEKTAEIQSETGIEVRFPWMYFGYIDASKGNGEIQPASSIGDNGLLPNPFNGLGIKWLHFHVSPEAMWGTGQPWMLMQSQDYSNIAWTFMCRAMNQSESKIVAEKSSIESGKIGEMLNNDGDRPILWKREGQWSTPPTRIAGTPFPQTATQVIDMSQSAMARQAQIAPVQGGFGPRRDGSGKAMEVLAEQADTIPEDRITSDEIALGALLRDTLIDTIRLSTVKQLQRITGGKVGESFLLELKREDPRLRIATVDLDPTTMRPRTKTQTEARYVGLATALVLEPAQAVKEAVLAGITGLNSAMEQAYDKQDAEVEMMFRGEDPPIDLSLDYHVWHIERLAWWGNKPESLDWPEEVLMRMGDHSRGHQRAQNETTGMAMGQPEPMATPSNGRGSPPAGAPGSQGGQAAGSAGPALKIA